MVQNTPPQSEPLAAAPRQFGVCSIEERRTRMQYRPDGLLLVNPGGCGDRDMTAHIEKLTAARATRFNGNLSPGAQKNLMRSFDNILLATSRKMTYNRYIKKTVPFQLGMITLTLPTSRLLSSKEMNARLLKRFLQMLERFHLKQRNKPLLYLWKLELQERGQLHWHIITNGWFPYEWINKQWAYLLKDTTIGQENFEKFGNWNASAATSVESVRRNTAGEMRSYLLKKYMLKDADKSVRKNVKAAKELKEAGKMTAETFSALLKEAKEKCSQIDGGVWGCSDALKTKYCTLELDYKTSVKVMDYIRANPKHCKHFEYCMIIVKDGKPPPEIITPYFKGLINCMREYIRVGGESGLKHLLN